MIGSVFLLKTSATHASYAFKEKVLLEKIKLTFPIRNDTSTVCPTLSLEMSYEAVPNISSTT